jgi:hypothetical protein
MRTTSQKLFTSLSLLSALALPGTSLAITPEINGRWFIDFTYPTFTDFPVEISYTSTSCTVTYQGQGSNWVPYGSQSRCYVSWVNGQYEVRWSGWGAGGAYYAYVSSDAQRMTGAYYPYYPYTNSPREFVATRL